MAKKLILPRQPMPPPTRVRQTRYKQLPRKAKHKKREMD